MGSSNNTTLFWWFFLKFVCFLNILPPIPNVRRSSRWCGCPDSNNLPCISTEGVVQVQRIFHALPRKPKRRTLGDRGSMYQLPSCWFSMAPNHCSSMHIVLNFCEKCLPNSSMGIFPYREISPL
jgi:hypothetical protein